VFTEITVNFDAVPGWVVMWLLALLIWLACKLLTWRAAVTHGRFTAALAYFTAWPGLDPLPFLALDSVARVSKPRSTLPCDKSTGWKPALQSIARILIGFALVLIAARHLSHLGETTAGWIGMIGTVLVLHFGIFELITLAWRARGIGVAPIMRKPLLARSVTDFWSRWNVGFRDLAFRVIFRPLRKRTGATFATLATFIFSGIVHDIVLSLPARGGFGLPTLYFLIQGVGVLFEKSALGRRLMNPIARRAIMYIALIAPLGLLFHRSFIHRVFVPFLIAIGGAS
jgi:hypothetical protein